MTKKEKKRKINEFFTVEYLSTFLSSGYGYVPDHTRIWTVWGFFNTNIISYFY